VFAGAVIFLRYRALLFTTFDPDVADVSGVNVARTDALLMLVLSLGILTTLRVIGVTLVAATLVIPAVVARMLTNSFARMLAWSTAVGAACGFAGMNASYHLDVPSGTTIVLTGALVFSAVLIATGRRRVRRTAMGDKPPAPSVPAATEASIRLRATTKQRQSRETARQGTAPIVR
jgi:ABC-type Mn2+/Zn2+ transport system permease subunit